jgi:transcriptional regulator with XRE-family HTH domain
MTGKDIKRERENLGLSQAALAQLVGVTEHTVWRWEAGLRIPHPVVLKAVNNALVEVREKCQAGQGVEANAQRKGVR